MSAFQMIFAWIAIISMILGVIFIFVDGMLLHSIAFFVIGFMIMLTKVMWGISVAADRAVRRFTDGDSYE